MDDTLKIISTISEKSSKYIERELEKVGIVGLVSSHGNILITLFGKKELTMTEIASKIGKDRSTVTTLVKKLIKLGYADIKDNPNDSRSTLVYLTSKGEEIIQEMPRISNQVYETQYMGISEEEINIFRKVLINMNKNFDEL